VGLQQLSIIFFFFFLTSPSTIIQSISHIRLWRHLVALYIFLKSCKEILSLFMLLTFVVFEIQIFIFLWKKKGYMPIWVKPR